MKTTIDAAGRLVIPKSIRDEAGLRAGQEVHLEWRDSKVVLEPVRPEAKLVRRGRRYVLAAPPGTPPLGADVVRRTLEEIREQRTRRVLRGAR